MLSTGIARPIQTLQNLEIWEESRLYLTSRSRAVNLSNNKMMQTISDIPVTAFGHSPPQKLDKNSHLIRERQKRWAKT
jgi:hypothetical protein